VSAPVATGAGRGPTRPLRWETVLTAALLAYFVARAAFFALTIAPGLPPDEDVHLGRSLLFTGAALLPTDSEATHALGPVRGQPSLYYVLMGKLLALNVLGITPLAFLRLVNLGLAALTALAAYRLSRRLTGDPLVRLLALAMLTNTLMFTFLAGAVNYDNLVTLLAVLATDALVAFLRGGGPPHLVRLLLWCAAGALTKTSFLPLAAILAVVLVLERRRGLGSDLHALALFVRAASPAGRALVVLALAAVAGTLWLYGGNVVRHGRLSPRCDEVLGHAACMKNAVYARDWVFRQYAGGSLTFDEALRAAGALPWEGMARDTAGLLHSEHAFRTGAQPPLNLWDYVGAWLDRVMKPGLLGIVAHRSMLKERDALVPYSLIFAVAFLAWVRQVSLADGERIWAWLSLIVVLYAAVLVLYVHYPAYRATHSPFFGASGRYLFPVLVAAYLVASRALLHRMPRAVRWGAVAVVGAVFVLGDLPWFLGRADAGWFAAGAR
jgi:hypothetical protein